ncbi:MAG: iron-binding protein hemerythrin [Bacillales bacterium]|nr:iron-binding protein hemerythrin [Bacillales bacterium]
MIKWKDDFLVGVEIIDEQHKVLFDLTGKAYELLKDDYVHDKYDEIVKIIDELKEYTIFHFKCEEEYMKSIGYKKFLSHKVEHDDFIERVNSLNFLEIDEDQDKYILSILDFVVSWISDHILQRDKLINP